MKKTLIISFTVVAAIIGSGIYISNASNQETVLADKLNTSQLEKAKVEIGEINNLEELIDQTLLMSFQKSEWWDGNNQEQWTDFQNDRNYAFSVDEDIVYPQFTKSNIQYLKNTLNIIELDSDEKATLDDLYSKWLVGSIDEVPKDQSVILINMDNTVLSDLEYIHTGTRSEMMEEQYINHHYGSKGIEINKNDWNPN